MQTENAKEILPEFGFIWVRLTIIKTSSKYWGEKEWVIFFFLLGFEAYSNTLSF